MSLPSRYSFRPKQTLQYRPINRADGSTVQTLQKRPINRADRSTAQTYSKGTSVLSGKHTMMLSQYNITFRNLHKCPYRTITLYVVLLGSKQVYVYWSTLYSIAVHYTTMHCSIREQAAQQSPTVQHAKDQTLLKSTNIGLEYKNKEQYH